MPLTTEKAQPPAAHGPGSSSSSSHPTIDDGYFFSEAEKNLDEVAAPPPPPPVLDRSEGYIRQHDYLENVRSSTSRHSALPENGDEAQPEALHRHSTHGGSVRTSHHSKTLNKIINYSYLVFFTIAGTLTRIVIENLTYYPGAPVSTSVLWANVGGSFIMGFLSEDQALFRIDTHH